MTMTEMIQREMIQAQEDMDSLKKQIDEAVARTPATAASDWNGMLAGIGLAHAAIEIAKLSAKYDAAHDLLRFLKYVMREAEDSPAKIDSTQQL